MRTCSQVTAHVAVFRGATYDVVADWEFSPACGRAAWRDDARRPVPRNVAKELLRRSRICEVGIADHGRAFSFRTAPVPTQPDSTVWCYRFEPPVTAPMSPSPTRSSNCHLGRCSPLDRLLLPHHLDMRPHPGPA
jgi:hypothetical protein